MNSYIGLFCFSIWRYFCLRHINCKLNLFELNRCRSPKTVFFFFRSFGSVHLCMSLHNILWHSKHVKNRLLDVVSRHRRLSSGPYLGSNRLQQLVWLSGSLQWTFWGSWSYSFNQLKKRFLTPSMWFFSNKLVDSNIFIAISHHFWLLATFEPQALLGVFWPSKRSQAHASWYSQTDQSRIAGGTKPRNATGGPKQQIQASKEDKPPFVTSCYNPHLCCYVKKPAKLLWNFHCFLCTAHPRAWSLLFIPPCFNP